MPRTTLMPQSEDRLPQVVPADISSLRDGNEARLRTEAGSRTTAKGQTTRDEMPGGQAPGVVDTLRTSRKQRPRCRGVACREWGGRFGGAACLG